VWPFRRDAARRREVHESPFLVPTAMIPPPAASPPPPPPPPSGWPGRAGHCDRPPAGWTCPRGYGHDGPCAASPVTGPPTMPHCDQAVLHAPGDCRYCDAHPDWQHLRQLWGIAFTGHPPRVDADRPWLSEVPCPSDARRPGGVNQRWPGNQPS